MSIVKSSIRELDQMLIKLELLILVLHLLVQVLTRGNLYHLIHLQQARDMVVLDWVTRMLEKLIHLMTLGKQALMVEHRAALGVVEDQYQPRWAQNHFTHLSRKTAFIIRAGR